MKMYFWGTPCLKILILKVVRMVCCNQSQNFEYIIVEVDIVGVWNSSSMETGEANVVQKIHDDGEDWKRTLDELIHY